MLIYKMEERVEEEHGCADRSGGGIEVVDVAVMDAVVQGVVFGPRVVSWCIPTKQ